MICRRESKRRVARETNTRGPGPAGAGSKTRAGAGETGRCQPSYPVRKQGKRPSASPSALRFFNHQGSTMKTLNLTRTLGGCMDARRVYGPMLGNGRREFKPATGATSLRRSSPVRPGVRGHQAGEELSRRCNTRLTASPWRTGRTKGATALRGAFGFSTGAKDD